MYSQLKIYFPLLVVCISGFLPAMAQPEINEAKKLVDSANAAFCKSDTAATIAILESIETLYPTDAVVAISNKALADLYIAQGRIKEAKEKLLYGISFTKTSRSVSYKTVAAHTLKIAGNFTVTIPLRKCFVMPISLSKL